MSIADNHFATLRTKAVRGLREHSSGTNPALHLGAVEHPSHDPQSRHASCFARFHHGRKPSAIWPETAAPRPMWGIVVTPAVCRMGMGKKHAV